MIFVIVKAAENVSNVKKLGFFIQDWKQSFCFHAKMKSKTWESE